MNCPSCGFFTKYIIPQLQKCSHCIERTPEQIKSETKYSKEDLAGYAISLLNNMERDADKDSQRYKIYDFMLKHFMSKFDITYEDMNRQPRLFFKELR